MESRRGEKSGYPDANLYPPTNPPPYNEQPNVTQPRISPSSPLQGPSNFTAIPPGATVVQGVVAQPVGPRSTNVTCQSCNQQIMTRVEYTPSTKTHLIAVLLCVCGCLLCSCIPYCVDSCRNAEHYCPKCAAYIGVFQS